MADAVSLESSQAVRSAPRGFVRYLTLVAIAAVVVLVSLPRLSEFALHENQSDAESTMTRLAGALASSRTAEAELTIAKLVATRDGLAKWATDAELLHDGRLLRRHGYLFDVVADSRGRPTLRAWPWEAGKTGVQSWIARAGEARWWVHPNSAGECSGISSPPDLELVAEQGGWSAIEPGR